MKFFRYQVFAQKLLYLGKNLCSSIYRGHTGISMEIKYIMADIEILRNDVFCAFSGLHPRKGYGCDGVPFVILRNSAPVLAHNLIVFFQFCLLHLPFPLAGSLPTLNLFLKRVTDR